MAQSYLTCVKGDTLTEFVVSPAFLDKLEPWVLSLGWDLML